MSTETENSTATPGGAPERETHALRLKVEAQRQLSRLRTKWVFGIILALPLIVVAAFAVGGDNGGGRPDNFADLATAGSGNFALFLLLVSSELLLLIVAALFVGDPVPSEASWSSLRYLLIAPVPRGRLLTAKLTVGLLFTALATAVLLGWVLLVGGVFYGFGPLTLGDAGSLDWGQTLTRLGIGALYVFIVQLPFAALALWTGVRSDAPLAAVGIAVIAVIVSAILDQLSALGDWRHALPTHYNREWVSLFTPNADFTALVPGVMWALLYAVVLTALAYRHFLKKDVIS